MKKNTTGRSSKTPVLDAASAPVAPAGTRWAAGIDLGDTRSHVCIYGDGREIAHFRFDMTREGVNEAFFGKGYAMTVVEAGGQSAWVVRQLRELGYDPVVANPRKLKAISSSDRKSDRNDAILLARLALADRGLLHAVTHRTPEQDAAMSMLRVRDSLVRQRAKLVSMARSVAKATGVRLVKCTAASFAMRLVDLPLTLQPILKPISNILTALNQQISDLDKALEELMKQSFPEADYADQVHGVGPVTALAFTLALGDPKRFQDGEKVAAYFGLVPRRDQSGVVDKQLGISKAGNGFVRRLLVQCSQYILGKFGQDGDLRRWGLALVERGGPRAMKRAVIATARKLAVLLFRLVRDKLTWKPLFNAEKASATSADAHEDLPKSRTLTTAPPSVMSCENTDVGVQIAASPVRIPTCTGSSDPIESANRSVDAGKTTKRQRTRGPEKAPRPSAGPQTAAADSEGPGDDDRAASADGDRGCPPPVSGRASGAGQASAAATAPDGRSIPSDGASQSPKKRRSPDERAARPPAPMDAPPESCPPTTPKTGRRRVRSATA